MLDRILMGAAADDKLFVEDVFSTYLYTGTGAAQTITNGIDLAGKGGLVWTKARSAANAHLLYDTARGATKYLISNSTSASQTNLDTLSSFNANGFTLGPSDGSNQSGTTGASWTFRKAPKFFDVVTYTGNGGDLTINHSLGVQPGCIIIKKTSGTGDWLVSHRYNFGGAMLKLNTTDAAFSAGIIATATTFRVFGGAAGNSDSGATYVAYIFAHDTTSDGIIQCGSFTTDGSGNATVNLGYEPQWMLLKRSDGASDWSIQDNMRGWTVGNSSGQNVNLLYPNESVAENYGGTASSSPKLTNTGFTVESYGAGRTYIYIAIRRGPMRTPTLGTSVFAPVARAGTSAGVNVPSGFVTDLVFIKTRASTQNWVFGDRLRGGGMYLSSNLTSADANSGAYPGGTTYFDTNNGVKLGSDSWVNTSSATYGNFLLQRAPGFFDTVCYTGTGSSAQTVAHNLTVVPELLILKGRSAGTSNDMYWITVVKNNDGKYSYFLGDGRGLSSTSAANLTNFPANVNGTIATSTIFTPYSLTASSPYGGYTSGQTYVAYLFASCLGVSKVGSYTGTGESDGSPATGQTINCGFSNGARFVLIKATSSSGNWFVFDTARGITTTASPFLWLNSNVAEQSGTGNLNYVEPHATGFSLAHDEGYINACNYKGTNYIFLAIA